MVENSAAQALFFFLAVLRVESFLNPDYAIELRDEQLKDNKSGSFTNKA